MAMMASSNRYSFDFFHSVDFVLLVGWLKTFPWQAVFRAPHIFLYAQPANIPAIALEVHSDDKREQASYYQKWAPRSQWPCIGGNSNGIKFKQAANLFMDITFYEIKSNVFLSRCVRLEILRAKSLYFIAPLYNVIVGKSNRSFSFRYYSHFAVRYCVIDVYFIHNFFVFIPTQKLITRPRCAVRVLFQTNGEMTATIYDDIIHRSFVSHYIYNSNGKLRQQQNNQQPVTVVAIIVIISSSAKRCHHAEEVENIW